MLRATWARVLGVVVTAGASAACDSARLVDTYSTTQVILRETPALGSPCTTSQALTVDLLSHSLSYAICTSSTPTSDLTSGTIAVTDREYPGLLSVLEQMKDGASPDSVGGAGVFTAVVLDGGDTLQWIQGETAGEGMKTAKGIGDAFDAAYAIVLAHRADGDTGAAGVATGANAAADGGH